METYVFPRIGDKPVSDVTHADILGHPRADLVREARDRQARAAAHGAGVQVGDPARPAGEGLALHRHRAGAGHHVTSTSSITAPCRTPRCRPSSRRCAHAARSEVTKLAFEWLILTATRSGETRGARWDEIDETQALWTIPKERMKGRCKRREHVVPLSGPMPGDRQAGARAQSRQRAALSRPAHRRGAVGHDVHQGAARSGLRRRATAHGFRSSFRDWATEIDKVREVVAEAALAHTVRDKTEAAYRRAAYLDERKALMQRWARYCTA